MATDYSYKLHQEIRKLTKDLDVSVALEGKSGIVHIYAYSHKSDQLEQAHDIISGLKSKYSTIFPKFDIQTFLKSEMSRQERLFWRDLGVFIPGLQE